MNFTVHSDGTLFRVTSAGKVTLGPRLTETALGSRWADDPKDDAPTDQRWSDAYEQMLCWLSERFPAQYYDRVLSRLRGKPRTRDETFAEIIAAYYIETVCGYRVTEWEPEFARKTADFSIVVPHSTLSSEILVEVKAPSWTSERVAEIEERIKCLQAQLLEAQSQGIISELHARLVKERDSLSGVNSERKYGTNLKAKSSDSRDDVCRALTKACFENDGETKRLPDDRPTLLVIVDDLELSMHEPGGDFMIKRALYARPSAPVYPSGLFLDERFNRLAALATMTKDRWPHAEEAPEPKFFSLFPNFRALPACRLPNGAFSRFLADLNQFADSCNKYPLAGAFPLKSRATRR
jgi:hypothetical protein